MSTTETATLLSNPRAALPTLPPDADTLPIIDITPYLPGHGTPASRDKTAAALHAACRDFGFFYLDIAGFVDAAQTEELAALAHRFFGLEEGVKEKLHIQNEDLARGEW
jgi:isopenicillin N synthase-like dioxygenase